jgi:hypothetical protein
MGGLAVVGASRSGVLRQLGAFAAGLPAARWSDRSTWGGRVPGRNDVARIGQPVLLDVDAQVAGVHIGPRGALVFDPTSSRRLASRGNVVVAGRLEMRPAGPHIAHRITFVGINEARFRGGHVMAPLPTDVGLWVVGAGVLDAHGTPKRPWTRLARAAQSGARSITVADAAGWRVGDEIVITPTERPTVRHHWAHHDRRRIVAIAGRTLRLDRPLSYRHPAITVRPGVIHRAEVLNLTRNVVIAGTPAGRSHLIFLMTTRPQQLAHVHLHDMGPRHGDDEVLGRYALHFHVAHDGSRGSVVDGVVVSDSTGHAFAAHLSNGVTFRGCVAHDLVDDAFWWDLSLSGEGRDLVPSHDIHYDRCVAHYVRSGGNSKFNLTGFLMGAGHGNVARGCVATGVEGGAESSAGFHWPSHSRDDNTWTFVDNLAHNNRHSGIYFWQNGARRTIVDRFTAYHCDQGIFAGSYSNLVSYRRCTIYACRNDGLIISALPARSGLMSNETITYQGMYIDQDGLSDFAVRITKHLAQGGRITRISRSTFRGGRRAQIGLPQGGDHPQLYDFARCRMIGNNFWLAGNLPFRTRLRVRPPVGDPYVVRRRGRPGRYRRAWNASVS